MPSRTDVARMVDHTLLKPESTPAQVAALLDEDGEDRQGEGDGGGQSGQGGGDALTPEELQQLLYQAMMKGDDALMRAIARQAVKRFAGMDWSILTPYECAHWDGTILPFTPGVPRSAAPDEDALDDLWRTYYRSIFNPARLKVNAMQSEMPKKYWKNLPEASLIEGLIADSRKRVKTMLETEERPVKPAPKNDYLESLRKLNEDANGDPSS
mgnify:CR=1 FL=1